MDNFPRLKRLLTKSAVHFYSGMVAIWCIVTGFIIYDYVIFASVKETKKWWTLVEAIYEPISYLPYRGNHTKNIFYQKLLFRGCKDEFNGNKNPFSDPLCVVTTKDNKLYTVRIQTGQQRSDANPIILDDILFTYKNIVVGNIWQQPYLTQYQDIVIERSAKDTLTITFPNKDPENISFFNLPILPRHSIEKITSETYITTFANNPVSSNCAKLDNSNDKNSIIFDLTNCKNSNINYYQIKLFNSYQEFLSLTESSTKRPISLYAWSTIFTGYTMIPVVNDNYMTMFFNNSSPNMSPRIQRALWWLVYNKFSGEKNKFLILYQWLFSHHQSDGDNTEDFIRSKNKKLNYDRQSLEQAWVKALPSEIVIEWSDAKKAYAIPKTADDAIAINLSTTEQFDNLTITTDPAKTILKGSTKDQYRKHTLSLSIKKDLRDGDNTITIQAIQKWKKKTIVKIELYHLGDSLASATWPKDEKKLKVLYFQDDISIETIQQFKKIIQEKKIDDIFDIQWYNDSIEFVDKIKEKDYDILFTSLQMSNVADLAAVITNDEPEKNPSLYKNIELAKFLEEYTKNPTPNKEKNIADIFSTDMPFVILGQTITPFWLKNDLKLDYTGTIKQSYMRQIILQDAHIISHLSLRWWKLLEKTTFIEFLQSLKK